MVQDALKAMQMKYNNESNPVEAMFVFPMHDQSCVYKFEAEIEGRCIVAEIQDKTQAKETYADAIASGHTAMMMSEDDQSGDIFEVKLGNLPANTEAKLTLGYVRELTVESDGTVVFTLPTLLNPRYTPAGSPPTLDSQVPYVSSTSVPYAFTFTAKIEGNFIIEQVYSKTEKLKVEKSEDGKTAMVELDESYKFDHDLSLEVKYQSNNEPQIILEKKLPDGGKYTYATSHLILPDGVIQFLKILVGLLKEDVLMLNYFPEFKDETKVKGEYVFIIDRSGSMQGHNIEQAKETLLLLIKSLPQDCMFNIIGFGNNYESLFEKSKLYNEDSLNKAKKHQKSIQANMGGTEILQPLQYVYSVDVQPTYSRQVFLLTDGEVSNTDVVIALVKRNAHTTRVFSFGIGSGASTSLVEGVARVSGGRATYVRESDRLQSKVISALKCSMEPSIIDIELEWNLPKGVTATNIPSKVPMESKTESSLKLKGKMESKHIEHTQTFDLSSAAIKDNLVPLHRLAAKSQIKDLEYDIDVHNFDYGK
ncbi:hypothetical protein KUTeg_011375 [Tegillarca granosa]|uniref:Uncharacterized protein n=1 Tax=Tegillarca granosa TaxID=220873 RepID=A0ABQ9F0Y2_TEGGR|nr:hypothetical protein KUTeg_011375 [Tegillarca granosa]